MTNVSKQRIQADAIKYANKNKKRIARECTDPKIYSPQDNPVSVFMAGSPGAGKTEASKRLVEQTSKDKSVIRIDPDDFREKIPGYTGHNSWLFNGAVAILVSKVHDFALKQNQSFIFDGTFTNTELVRENIQRSLKRKRFIQILYVYQEPDLAWDFVQKREIVEGRNIPLDSFIKKYFKARFVVNKMKEKFGADIQVDVLWKDVDGSDKMYKENVDNVDNVIPEKYHKDDLRKLLNEG